MLELPLIPLTAYVATMSVTPGPNNLMLAASGVNFGFRRTLPHLLGISVGLGVQVALVAGVMAWVMAWFDAGRLAPVSIGCAYLLWLAWRQAQAGAPGARERARQLGFIAAALFQWVNPKAWMMVINAAILFLPRGGGASAGLFLATWCALVNFPCIAVWAAAGDLLRHRLSAPRALKIFNFSMTALLALTAMWIAVDEGYAAAPRK